MKTSDSVNSLTELNPSEKQEKTCFICLGDDDSSHEPLVDSKLLRNCGCKFAVHPACWNEWLKGKSDYDCPICRKDSMLRIKIPPNPVLAIEYEESVVPSRWRYCRFCIYSICLIGTIFLIISIVKWG
jgi:hypothetical protein